jgi:hypothetical protein
MLWAPSSGYSYQVDNFGANPSATPGTAVTPGTSSAEGSWTQLLTALAYDLHAFYLQAHAGSVASQNKMHLLDLGIDPAGGSSYTAVLNNLAIGSADALANGLTHPFFFPLRLPAGATVAARVQGVNATATAVRVMIQGYGQPSGAHLLPVGTTSETIGTITSTAGVSFTPGAAADGAWQALGTTTKRLWWWQGAFQINSNAISARQTYVDLGVGDATTKRTLCRMMAIATGAETIRETLGARLVWPANYCVVPAGSTLYVRGRTAGGSADVHNAVAIGVG